MLPLKNRLPAANFKLRFEKSVAGSYFLIRRRLNKFGYNRLGVIIGAKVDKRAVRRNYLKRRFREYFRKLAGNIGADFLVIVSPKAGSADFKEIKKELDKTLLVS